MAASTNPSFSDPIPLLAIHVHVHSGDALGRAVDGLTSVCEVTSREGRCELTANPPLGPNGQPRKGRAYWESDTAWGEADSHVIARISRKQDSGRRPSTMEM